MIAKKVNNLIEISFQYDQFLVSFIKSLDGRKYLPGKKLWTIPLANSALSVKRLRERGFYIEPALMEAVKADENEAREAEALSVMPDTEFETLLPLYPFQRVVSAFMVKVSSCLNACGVRTGKTIMTLATIQKNNTKKNLVIAPGSILYQWQEECNRFLPNYKTFVITGTLKERVKVYEQVKKYDDYFFLIMSYDIARVDKELLVNEVGL